MRVFLLSFLFHSNKVDSNRNRKLVINYLNNASINEKLPSYMKFSLNLNDFHGRLAVMLINHLDSFQKCYSSIGKN
jgi:hypothetical protein